MKNSLQTRADRQLNATTLFLLPPLPPLLAVNPTRSSMFRRIDVLVATCFIVTRLWQKTAVVKNESWRGVWKNRWNFSLWLGFRRGNGWGIVIPIIMKKLSWVLVCAICEREEKRVGKYRETVRSGVQKNNPNWRNTIIFHCIIS